MTSPSPTPAATRACPHCAKNPGLRWTALLPSNNRVRSFVCQACGGRYDVSDVSKMASIFGGLLGIGPGIFLFGHLVRDHGGSAVAMLMGTAVVVTTFGVGSLTLAWLTMRFVSKPPL